MPETKLKEENLVRSLKTKGLKAIDLSLWDDLWFVARDAFPHRRQQILLAGSDGQPLSVWRTAYDQKRPYPDLSDAVRAFPHIIEHDLFDGRVYNVSTLNATVRRDRRCRSVVCAARKDIIRDSPIMNQLSYEVSAQRFLERDFVLTGDLRRGIRRDDFIVARGAPN